MCGRRGLRSRCRSGPGSCSRLDHPALKTLPVEAFAYSEWRKGRLDIDYHAEVEHHLFSAPHALVHEELEARLTPITVDCA